MSSIIYDANSDCYYNEMCRVRFIDATQSPIEHTYIDGTKIHIEVLEGGHPLNYHEGFNFNLRGTVTTPDSKFPVAELAPIITGHISALYRPQKQSNVATAWYKVFKHYTRTDKLTEAMAIPRDALIAWMIDYGIKIPGLRTVERSLLDSLKFLEVAGLVQIGNLASCEASERCIWPTNLGIYTWRRTYDRVVFPDVLTQKLPMKEVATNGRKRR